VRLSARQGHLPAARYTQMHAAAGPSAVTACGTSGLCLCCSSCCRVVVASHYGGMGARRVIGFEVTNSGLYMDSRMHGLRG
jgi:hypothetical protein